MCICIQLWIQIPTAFHRFCFRQERGKQTCFKLPQRYKDSKAALLVTLSDYVYFSIESGGKCLTEAKYLSTFSKYYPFKNLPDGTLKKKIFSSISTKPRSSYFQSWDTLSSQSSSFSWQDTVITLEVRHSLKSLFNGEQTCVLFSSWQCYLPSHKLFSLAPLGQRPASFSHLALTLTM